MVKTNDDLLIFVLGSKFSKDSKLTLILLKRFLYVILNRKCYPETRKHAETRPGIVTVEKKYTGELLEEGFDGTAWKYLQRITEK
jgi:hypothetical protein